MNIKVPHYYKTKHLVSFKLYSFIGLQKFNSCNVESCRGLPGCMMSDNPAPGIMCGAGKLRLGRLAKLGSPAGNGIRPKIQKGQTNYKSQERVTNNLNILS